MIRAKTKWLATLSIAVLSGSVFADAELEKLAKELVQKRTQVDEISTALDFRKTELESLQSSSEIQAAELQRLIKGEETRLGQLAQEIKIIDKKLRESEVPGEKIKPILYACLDSLEKEIAAGMPFKKDARLNEVKDIREMLLNNKLVSEKGLSKVWSMLESEFRLSRENGLYRQDIEMDGTMYQADIVKIGMKKMFFKVSEEKVGQVLKKGDSYEYVYASKREDIQNLNILFENFQKKIRTGYFVLPKI